MRNILFVPLVFLVFSCSDSNNSDGNEPKEISGVELYNQWCVVCHGDKGNALIGGAKDLSISSLSLEDKKNIILNGSESKLMRGFKDDLSTEELDALLQHIESLVIK